MRSSWLVLNGRCPSNSLGAFTNVQFGRRTVLDLAVVPWVARADLQVVPVLHASSGHRGLLVSVFAPRADVAGAAPSGEGMERPARVKLTPE